jgi:hypothetical protein
MLAPDPSHFDPKTLEPPNQTPKPADRDREIAVAGPMSFGPSGSVTVVLGLIAILSALGTGASFLSFSSTLNLEPRSKAVHQILRYGRWATSSKFDASNINPLIAGGSLVLWISIFVGTSISLHNEVAKYGAIIRLCWVFIILAASFCMVAGVTAAELFLVFLPPLVSTSLALGSILSPKDVFQQSGLGCQQQADCKHAPEV